MKYPAVFEPAEEGGFIVSFRDIPEAITQGDTEEEALAMAQDALVTAMDFYLEDGRQVPMPSRRLKGEKLVEMPVSVSAKVLLLNAMLSDNCRPVDLAHRMKIKPQRVTEIMDLNHSTKIDTIAAAFKALGKSIELRVS